VVAAQVVMAVGHTYFAYTPPVLRGISKDLVSHVMDHRGFEPFAGRTVTVVGAGQSALETSALLHEAGADVNILVRAEKLAWNGDPVERSLRVRLRAPESGLGPGWKSLFYSNAPQMFRPLPRSLREEIVRRALGPAGAWWLRPRVLGKVPVSLDTVVRSATPHGSGLQLDVVRSETSEVVTTEHVIAGTGYRVDVNRIPFLDRELLARVRQAGTVPVLNAAFESSVPGLYFVGLSAAQTFGPVQRFVFGADFAARRVGKRVARQVGKARPAPAAVQDDARRPA
jgi:thioredoxin reductase